MAYAQKKQKLKQGNSYYLKKTGEKFTIVGNDDDQNNLTIADEKGTEFYGIKADEFKKSKETPVKEKPAYFYQWGKHHTSKYGGQDGELNVYEIKDGEFVLIGSAFVQTRAMKGFEGEAMDILYEKGKISKEEYDKDHGYYRRDKQNFKISSAGDMY